MASSPTRLLSLILIVSWYPHSESALTGTASGESTTRESTCAASRTTATCCAPGRLVEEMDDKETTTSDLKILKAFEIQGRDPGYESSNDVNLQSVGHKMSGHDKSAFVDCEERYVIDVTRCLDFPDDPVSHAARRSSPAAVRR